MAGGAGGGCGPSGALGRGAHKGGGTRARAPHANSGAHRAGGGTLGAAEGLLKSRHVPRSRKDPRSWSSRIQDPGSCRILDPIFSFSHGILEILDPVTATLPWDPRDLESQTDKILPDPGDPGSS